MKPEEKQDVTSSKKPSQKLVWSVVSACLFTLPVLSAWLAYQYALEQNVALDQGVLLELERELAEQQQEISNIEVLGESEIQTLATKVASLQARITRLDALGERLTDIADLESGEFDFSQPSAVGGPDQLEDHNLERVDGEKEPEFNELLADLDNKVESRERQLNILADMLENMKLDDELYLAGRPIKKGWLSSRYGYRTDPFTGKRAWHNGVDLAGKDGSDIIAVASGVVTFSGRKRGYGNIVEVSHGKGLVTKYAHAKETLVEVGEIVKKGQTLALMGSTGRSTGPHVHFEVYKHGRSVDPSSYIRRTHR